MATTPSGADAPESPTLADDLVRDAIRRALEIPDIAALNLSPDVVWQHLGTGAGAVITQVVAEQMAYDEAERGHDLAVAALQTERTGRYLINGVVVLLAIAVILIANVWEALLPAGWDGTVVTGVAIYLSLGSMAVGPFMRFVRGTFRQQEGRVAVAHDRLDKARARLLETLTIEVGAMIRQHRLGQPLHDDASPVRFDVTDAPDLVETDTQDVITSTSVRAIVEFVDRHGTSAVGVAGPRGVGKTTIIRKATSRPEYLGVYIAAPVHYDAADFVRLMHAKVARAILAEQGIFEESIATAAPRSTMTGRRAIVVITLALGTLLLVLGFEDQFIRLTGLNATALAGLMLLFSGTVLATQASAAPLRRAIGQVKTRDPLAELALAELRRLEWRTSMRARDRTRFSPVPLLRIDSEDQLSLTERDRTHPERVSDLRGFLLQAHQESGRPIVIAIDELDKMADGQKALESINNLKDLFHVGGVHFVVSVSEDALDSFALRGIPVRDVFDSAFDTVLRVEPFSIDHSIQLIGRRVVDFPEPVALLCHALSGGLPRDLIRAARRCVELRIREGTALTLDEVARGLVRFEGMDVVDAALRRDRGDGTGVPDWLLTMRENLLYRQARTFDGVMEAVRDWQPAVADGAEGGDAAPRPEVPHEAVISYMLLAATVEDYFTNVRLWKEWHERIVDGRWKEIVESLARARAMLGLSYGECVRSLARTRNLLGLPVIPDPLRRTLTGEAAARWYSRPWRWIRRASAG
ncbi:hypothetical protein GCM10009557_32810 [Virgisporangium ochraceum]|uniref:Uncharacterized protein n=1 Tax=Virgisporangium ochraceum TaxID=65505 RepID=A0A8J4EHK1_9ACTN|nr:hypothetical protein [Virgisporangium ochraceum]GIJ72282.1 hypothetical protein Voc01_071990 [Virgisporangium ochraceum]